jgi:hypothetical protein
MHTRPAGHTPEDDDELLEELELELVVLRRYTRGTYTQGLGCEHVLLERHGNMLEEELELRELDDDDVLDELEEELQPASHELHRQLSFGPAGQRMKPHWHSDEDDDDDDDDDELEEEDELELVELRWRTGWHGSGQCGLRGGTRGQPQPHDELLLDRRRFRWHGLRTGFISELDELSDFIRIGFMCGFPASSLIGSSACLYSSGWNSMSSKTLPIDGAPSSSIGAVSSTCSVCAIGTFCTLCMLCGVCTVVSSSSIICVTSLAWCALRTCAGVFTLDGIL